MKKLLALILATVMILSMAACGASAPAEPEAPKTDVPEAPTAEEKKPDPVIYFVGPRTGGLAWNQAVEGFNAAIDELGYEGYFIAPQTPFNTAEQVDLLGTAMNSGADIVLTTPGDLATYGAIIDELRGNGIIVGTIQSPVEYVDFNVGPMYEDRARTYCEELEKLANGEGLKIVLLMTNAGDMADTVNKYIVDWCAERGNAELVLMDFVNGDAIQGSDKLAAALAANPDINAVIVPDATGSVGVATYVKENDRSDLYIISEANTGDVINSVIAGDIDTAVYWEFFDMGYQATKMSAEIYFGTAEYELYNDPGYSRIVADNAEQYAADHNISLSGS